MSSLLQSAYDSTTSTLNIATTTTSYLYWYGIYAIIFFTFFLFSSPYHGNRELRTKWNGYVYISTILYVWLGCAVAFHMPLLNYDMKLPVSLFSPLFLASVIALAVCEGVVKLANRWFVYHIGFKQNSIEVIQNSALLSIVCCLVYSQCGSSSPNSLLQLLQSSETSIQNILQNSSVLSTRSSDSIAQLITTHAPTLDHTVSQVCTVFLTDYSNPKISELPTVLVFWITGISIIIINYTLERLTVTRAIFQNYDLKQHSTATRSYSKKHKHVSTKRSTTHSDDRAGTSVASQGEQTTPPQMDQHKKSIRLTGALGAVGGDSAQPQNLNEYLENEQNEQNNDSSGNISDDTSECELGTYSDFVHANKRKYSYLYDMFAPVMLDMVPWYAMVTSYTVVDLIISLKLFLGRFDMRTLQSALPYSLEQPNEKQSHNAPRLIQQSHRYNKHIKQTSTMPFVYNQFERHEDFWFDWMADCGDGWNPSYQVAKTLAQPILSVNVKRKQKSSTNIMLPRPKLLIIGGDLAYPSPTQDTYEMRLFRPFECAMPPPAHYDPDALATRKPDVPYGDTLSTYNGPQCFAIPGNHDWFDGLQTFLRYICARDWLGGWLLPQEKSWFAIKLPHGWWLFGMDNALQDDIDYHQFKYFSDIADNMPDTDRVILMTHEPDWIVDSHFGVSTSSNIAHLTQKLRGRVVARVAGDIHNYTRHMPILKDQHITAKKWSWYDRLPSFIKPTRIIQALGSIGADLLHWSENSGSQPLYEELLQHCPTKLQTSPSTLKRMKSDPTTDHTAEYVDKHTPAVHGILTHSPTTSFNLLDSPPVSDTETEDDYMHTRTSSCGSLPTTPQMHHASTESNINNHNITYSAYGSTNHMNGVGSTMSLNHMSATSSTMPYASSNCIALDVSKLHEWSVNDVCTWLAYIGLHEHIHTFEHAGVDGKLLLALTDDDLSDDELNVTSKLRRKKILLELNALKQSMNNKQYLYIPHNISQPVLSALNTPNGTDLTSHNSALDLSHRNTSMPIHSTASANDMLVQPPAYERTTTEQSIEQFDAQKSVNITANDVDTITGAEQKPIDPPPVVHRNSSVDSTTQQPTLQSRKTSTYSDKRNGLTVNTKHEKKHAGRQATHWHGNESDTPTAPVMPPVLLVSGGGGAFMHPTHVPAPLPIQVRGQPYQRTCCYPSVPTSRNYALLNIFGFRKRNWRFDIMGGAVYFMLALSFFPMCNLSQIIESNTWTDLFTTYLNVVALTHIELFTESYISLAVFLCILFSTVMFTETNWSLLKRLTVGTVHAFAHSIAAISVLVLMECMIELGITKQIVAQTPLFDIFTQHFPEVQELFTLFDTYTYGITSYTAQRLTLIFDIPDAMARYKIILCHSPATMTRYQHIIYYCSTYLYYYVLSAPLVSFVFGTYLYTANCFLNAHLTESFSSLRIESYKNFIRFHINKHGDCEVFVLGMDRVPKQWKLNKQWTGYTEQSTTEPSYTWSEPSVWIPDTHEPNKVKLVDYMLLSKKVKAKERYSDLINDKKHIVPA